MAPVPPQTSEVFKGIINMLIQRMVESPVLREEKGVQDKARILMEAGAPLTQQLEARLKSPFLTAFGPASIKGTGGRNILELLVKGKPTGVKRTTGLEPKLSMKHEVVRGPGFPSGLTSREDKKIEGFLKVMKEFTKEVIPKDKFKKPQPDFASIIEEVDKLAEEVEQSNFEKSGDIETAFSAFNRTTMGQKEALARLHDFEDDFNPVRKMLQLSAKAERELSSRTITEDNFLKILSDILAAPLMMKKAP